MMQLKQFRGIVAYPVTPFNEGGHSVNTQALRELVERLLETGAHAIAPLGSTGESAYLSDEEWEDVAAATIAQVDRRVPTIVGISELTTAGAVRRAKFAEKSGADAVMVIPVAYWKLSAQEIFRHFATIAKAISIPIMVYNNPATSNVDMGPELIVKMAREIDNVAMVKESTGDIQRMHRIHQLSEGELPFFNGSNPLALEAFAAGASGWCTAAPNLAQGLPLQLYEAMRTGDLQKSRKLFYRQLPLLQFIVKGGLPATVKGGLRLQGFDAGVPRAPLEPLSEDGVKILQHILSDLGVSPGKHSSDLG